MVKVRCCSFLLVLFHAQLPNGHEVGVGAGRVRPTEQHRLKINIIRIVYVFVRPAVLEIQIWRIRMFLSLTDPNPLVRGMDPDP